VFVGEILCGTLPADTLDAQSEEIDGVSRWFTVICSSVLTGTYVKIKGVDNVYLNFAGIKVSKLE